MVSSRALERSDRRALFTSIAVSLSVAVITNGILGAFGLNRTISERWPSFAPPGHSIGAVWAILFAGMGAARWFAATSGSRHAHDDARAVTIFIVLCLAYPFYTHAIGGHATELAGNGVTLAYATWLAVRLRARSSVATFLVATVALWIVFATVLVFSLVRMNGWAT